MYALWTIAAFEVGVERGKQLSIIVERIGERILRCDNQIRRMSAWGQWRRFAFQRRSS
jgi:hypothetical protein